ncbi:hypothetical protein B0H14DRAFT_2640986 [Mycena olivaceomarginata]|nr:hypothetical protein B0H14DRAFT_2640986 [Mycena olivaceomarginata]
MVGTHTTVSMAIDAADAERMRDVVWWGVLRVAWSVECEKPTEGADVVVSVRDGRDEDGSGARRGSSRRRRGDGSGCRMYCGWRWGSYWHMRVIVVGRRCRRGVRNEGAVVRATQERDDMMHARELNREEGGEYQERKGGWEGNGLRKGKPRKRTSVSINPSRRGHSSDSENKGQTLAEMITGMVRSEWAVASVCADLELLLSGGAKAGRSRTRRTKESRVRRHRSGSQELAPPVPPPPWRSLGLLFPWLRPTPAVCVSQLSASPDSYPTGNPNSTAAA